MAASPPKSAASIIKASIFIIVLIIILACPSLPFIYYAAIDLGTPTIDPDEVYESFQPSPDYRGTFQLLSSSLLTVFACTWTVLHLNVPGLRDSAFRRFSRKSKWMLIAVLFPEFILCKAVGEMRMALKHYARFWHDLSNIRRTDNTNTHSDDEPDRPPLAAANTPDQLPSGPDSPRLLVWLDEKNELSEWTVAPLGAKKYLCDILGVKRCRDDNCCGCGDAITDEQKVMDYLGRLLEDLKILAMFLLHLPKEVFITAPQRLSELLSKSKNPQGYERGSGSDQIELSERGKKVDPPKKEKPAKLEQADVKSRVWTLRHSHFANMGGLVMTPPSPFAGPNTYWVLTGMELSSLYQWGSHPLAGLHLHDYDIKDKSKADGMLKFISILQILKSVVTVGHRMYEDLLVSQIEVATTVYGVFAILIYATNWWKPKDVGRPIILPLPTEFPRPYPVGNPEDVNRPMISSLPAKLDSSHRKDWVSESDLRKRLSPCHRYVINKQRVRNDELWAGWLSRNGWVAGTSWIFAVLHCLAWNSPFPTAIERDLWRLITLISIIGFPGALLGSCIIRLWLEKVWGKKPVETLFKYIDSIGVSFYAILRIVTIVLLFTPLRYLPIALYENVPLSSWLPTFD